MIFKEVKPLNTDEPMPVTLSGKSTFSSFVPMNAPASICVTVSRIEISFNAEQPENESARIKVIPFGRTTLFSLTHPLKQPIGMLSIE